MIIRAAKEKGLKITCEVAPHHLFLTKDDVSRIGPSRIRVKPELCTAEDQKALWDNMDIIDCFATDHGKALGIVICVVQRSVQSSIPRNNLNFTARYLLCRNFAG